MLRSSCTGRTGTIMQRRAAFQHADEVADGKLSIKQLLGELLCKQAA